MYRSTKSLALLLFVSSLAIGAPNQIFGTLKTPIRCENRCLVNRGATLTYLVRVQAGSDELPANLQFSLETDDFRDTAINEVSVPITILPGKHAIAPNAYRLEILGEPYGDEKFECANFLRAGWVEESQLDTSQILLSNTSEDPNAQFKPFPLKRPYYITVKTDKWFKGAKNIAVLSSKIVNRPETGLWIPYGEVTEQFDLSVVTKDGGWRAIQSDQTYMVDEVVEFTSLIPAPAPQFLDSRAKRLMLRTYEWEAATGRVRKADFDFVVEYWEKKAVNPFNRKMIVTRYEDVDQDKFEPQLLFSAKSAGVKFSTETPH